MCAGSGPHRAFKISTCVIVAASNGFAHALIDKHARGVVGDLLSLEPTAFSSSDLADAGFPFDLEPFVQGPGARVVHQEATLRGPAQHDVVGQPPPRQAPEAPAGGAQPVIPLQIVMTAKHGSLEEMPAAVQNNVRRTLALNPEMRTRWLGDEACGDFIRANFGSGLLAAFLGERRGSFRGDICRSAVLALEGGFYVDLDVQMRVPFSQMVDNATTFVSALSADGGVLNALIAAEAGSEVMQAVLVAIEDWYGGHRKDRMDVSQWMGPATMLRALREVAARDCPGVDFRDGAQLQRACGPRNQVRLYQERKLQCAGSLRAASADAVRQSLVECPQERRASSFEGLQFGIFEPGPGRNVVAWSRFASCDTWGCKGGGWDVGAAET